MLLIAAVTIVSVFSAAGGAGAQTPEQNSTAREIAPSVVWEPITGTPNDPNDGVDVSVGLSRYMIESGAVFDIVGLLGYGYAGPAQFYVEQGVMTITAGADSRLSYSTRVERSLRFPPEGEVNVPAQVAVYAPDGTSARSGTTAILCS